MTQINTDFFWNDFELYWSFLRLFVIPALPPSSFPRRRESSGQTVAFQATLNHQDLQT